MNKTIVLLLAGAGLFSCAHKHVGAGTVFSPGQWKGNPEDAGKGKTRPVVGARGMVVSDDAVASEWGAEILREGGNAVDAAVATAFALAVTRPHYASLGGGGFMVYCPKPQKVQSGLKPSACHVIDYRERAPKAATRDMFVKNGKAVPTLAQDGALASGIPGVTAGLLFALEKYGTLQREKVLSRPTELARKGFRVTGLTEYFLYNRWKAMNPEARKIFGCAGGKPCAAGTSIRQPDLARVLEAISAHGRDGFYRGWVAEKIVAGIRSGGGILTVGDLAGYQPKMRTPVTAFFDRSEIVTMPPPSAGGAVILQLFGFAERADRKNAFSGGLESADTVHALAQGMTLSFADRAKYFGDPDFVKVPVAEMLDPKYLDTRWENYDPHRANLSVDAGRIAETAQVPGEAKDKDHTTHFSVIDREGNAVAVTTTVNADFGSGFVPPGTGVFMNDEMDDFSIEPGVPNQFGLVGAEANAIAAGKTPLSSMSPTIVRDREGNARIVIGAAGGPRITTSVFLTLFYRLKLGLSLPDAVGAPRFHTQWKPQDLKVEGGAFSEDLLGALTRLGYSVKETVSGGGLAKVHALERFPNGRVWGAADPRAEGAAVAE